MKVKVKQLRNMEDVKAKMYTTMNDPERTPSVAVDDHTLNLLLLAQHSPINIAMFEVSAYVTDRVHSHMRTHRDIQHVYWCGSSREELPYGKVIRDGDGELHRFINFEIGIDGLIHICKRRLCPTAHVDVQLFINEVRKQVIAFEPILAKFLVRPCVWTGFCTEPRKDCGYMNSRKYTVERNQLVGVSNLELKKNRK